MKAIIKNAVGLISLLGLVIFSGCGEETGPCTITCFSNSSGANIGTNTFQNYTRDECEEALGNRQTNLTNCSLEFN